MRYYFVMCRRGHCGRGRYIEIGFAFQANNMIEAMDRAKKMPAVQHTKGILEAREITVEEYKEYRQVSAYKKCKGLV